MDEKKMRIGTYLVHKGYLTEPQANKVLELQQWSEENVTQQFGRIAIESGFITELELEKALKEREQTL